MNIKNGCILYIIKKLAIFFAVYFIGGMLAIYTIGWSFVITLEQQNFCDPADLNVMEDYISTIWRYIQNSVPYESFWEGILENISDIAPVDFGITSAFIGFISNIKEANVSRVWQEYFPDLWRDLAIATVAQLFFFLVTRLKWLVGAYTKISLKIAFFLINILWVISSYCLANSLIYVLENTVILISGTMLYVMIGIIACLIHIILLAGFGKAKLIHAGIILVTQMIFSILRSFFLCLWIVSIPNIFDFSHVELFWGSLILIAFILCFIESAEKLTMKGLSYPLYSR